MPHPPIAWGRVLSVLVGCVVLVVLTGALAFAARPCDSTFDCPDLLDWLDRDTSLKAVLVGAAAGVAFGLVDNALLFIGMNELDTLFARLPGGSMHKVLAGYGNCFSSVISAFVSTFIGRWIADVTHVDVSKAPMWSMALGILVGCLCGIVLPMLLLENARASR